jgi:hypothetical protein
MFTHIAHDILPQATAFFPIAPSAHPPSEHFYHWFRLLLLNLNLTGVSGLR